MTAIAISATGLFTPPHAITNDELVASFNAFAALYNDTHAAEIASGGRTALEPSSAEFIEKASGVKARYVLDKEGVLDPNRMRPRLAPRSNDQPSLMAEMAAHAAKQALERAGRTAKDIDAVICAASNMQRAYPAMGVEIQHVLGIEGFAYDMNVACSSATFAIMTAADYIRAGHAQSVLVVNPEITSAHLNWRDRDSHFIFGDVATAILVENAELAPPGSWAVLGTRLKTQFSNNIRNNAGFVNRCEDEEASAPLTDKLFVQEGRKVFKEVVPMVSDLILLHMAELQLKPGDLKRLWLHQANANMNRLISARVLGREATLEEAPDVLSEYANTSSAGAIIAFHKHNSDLEVGDRGLICSFGAGYSVGSVFVQKAG